MFRIILSDASLVYPADVFEDREFFGWFQTGLQAFLQLWNFQKNTQEKQYDEV